MTAYGCRPIIWGKKSLQIKLRAAGCCLVYEVRDSEVVVLVVALGKRGRNAAYYIAVRR